MAEAENNKSTFWSIVSVLVKWRRLFAVNFLLAAFITFVVASFMPKWYSSTASIFPPEQEAAGFGLATSILGSGLGSMLSGSGMSLPAFASLSDLYATVLRSRVVAEHVMETNDLKKVYGVESTERALLELAGHTLVRVEPEGVIRVSVEDKDPELAAALAASYVDGLNWVNSNVRTTKASAARQFIEDRLAQTQIELATAEEEFRQFQLNHKAISLDDQLRSAIENLAQLRGQLVLAEIELGVLRRTFLPSHTQVKQQEAKIEEIKKQLRVIEQGTPDSSGGDLLNIPFSEAPDLSLELVRLTRNLKIQETIFELLTQQYEQAKIQEKKDTPTVQVLDPPKVPEHKSRPRRVKMGLLAGMLSLLFTVVAVFAKEYVDRNRDSDTEAYRQLENLLGVVRRDFYAIRSAFSFRRRRKNGRAN